MALIVALLVVALVLLALSLACHRAASRLRRGVSPDRLDLLAWAAAGVDVEQAHAELVWNRKRVAR